MQYKIPKNVGIEDKLFFFLTLRQLIICGIAASLCYVLYVVFRALTPVVWLIPSVVIALIAILIAFFRFNLMSFTRLVLRLLALNMLPAQRVYRQINDPITPLRSLEFTYDAQVKASAKTTVVPPSTEGLETDMDTLQSIVDLHRPTNE